MASGGLPVPPMGGQGPDGPPPPAAGSPTLSGVPAGGPPAPPSAGDALPKLVFQIDQSIQTLARALPPDAGEKLDAIRQELREIAASALSGGGAGQPLAPSGGPY